MTGAQLKKLRQVNGLSERQFAKVIRLNDANNVNAVRKVQRLEDKPFIPEPIVNLINAMVAEGKLVAR